MSDVGVLDPVDGSPSNFSWRRFGGLWRTAGILIPFLILFVILAITNSEFLTRQNLVVNILYSQTPILIIAAAGTLVLIAGGLDLSVAATFVLAQDVAAGIALHSNSVLAIVAALACGALVGLVNGAVVAYLRINALIATLAMAFVVSGIAEVATNNTFYSLFEKPALGKFATTNFLGAQSAVWITLVVVVLLGMTLWRTAFGRYVFAAGGNAEAARLAGVRVSRVRIITFVLSGTAAALAGVISLAQTLTTTPYSSESSLAFTVLAGIVVGGTSIIGGEGSVSRTVIGVLFIALIQNGFELLQFNAFLIPLVTGIILIVAVALDVWLRQRRR
ncbi:MAG: ABC transporter permease [Acidimicrobiales bacterium]